MALRVDPNAPRLSALMAALETTPARPSSDYDLNPDVRLSEGRVLRPAAVLVAVWQDQILLTKRASHLKHHPGQIAFPGGKLEPGESPRDAALREAFEEVTLPRDAVTTLVDLPSHETVTGYSVTPVLAQIHRAFTPVPEPGEVAEVFYAPLATVLNPDRFRIEGRRWRGTKRHYYTVPYGPYYIWGATARILKSLADQRASHAA